MDDDTPIAPAAGLVASAADKALVGAIGAGFLLGLLPAAWFVRLFAGGDSSSVTFGGWLLLPFGVWVLATWSLLSTFRRTVRTASPIRQRHGGLPSRYRLLGFVAVVVEVGTLLGVLVPDDVAFLPVDLRGALGLSRSLIALWGPLLVTVLAAVARTSWRHDGGAGAAPEARAQAAAD